MEVRKSELFEEALDQFEEALDAIEKAYTGTVEEGEFTNTMLAPLRRIEARLQAALVRAQEEDNE